RDRAGGELPAGAVFVFDELQIERLDRPILAPRGEHVFGRFAFAVQHDGAEDERIDAAARRQRRGFNERGGLPEPDRAVVLSGSDKGPVGTVGDGTDGAAAVLEIL